MSFSRPLVVVAIMAMIALIIGCSGGVPTSPSHNTTTDSLPIIAPISAGDASNAIGLLGAYELTIDPSSLTADLVAKRLTSAVGDSYLVSGGGFFTMWPCGNCFKLAGVELTSGGVAKLSFDVKHPFPPGDPTKPVSAMNRLDLDIFDVEAIVVPDNVNQTQYDLCDVYVGKVLNPTGYTQELYRLLSDDGALPYYLLVDDSVSGTSTYNKFPMGGTGSMDMYFDVSSGTLKFDIYLTFGYGHSALKKQRLTPTYFNPEFNRKNAWKVVVVPPQGTNPPAKGNTWENQDKTTLYKVKVMVYDWQHGNTSVAYPPVNPTDISASSNVASVSVEIPGMTDSPVSVTTPVSGTGAPNDPLVYEVPIANQNGLAPGEYLSLVEVLDERTPPSTIGAYDILIHSPDGIALQNYTIPKFATYKIWTATVVNSCGPITGSIVSPTCPVTGVGNGAKITFTVNASSANGGNPIVLYEADHDYNGTTFDAEVSSTTGVLSVGPFTVPDPCPSNIPKTFTVAFRAKDSCVPPNITIFATCQVKVESCFVWFKEEFPSNPADWAFADFQYWSGCTNVPPTWTNVAPFGPSGSGNIRFPATGNNLPGGNVSTVVTKPFPIPNGYSTVLLRVYACAGFGGSWSGYYSCNWKIVESDVPGVAPFNTNGALPSGGAHLQNNTSYGSTWGPYQANPASWGQMAGQPGWLAGGGGAFPASLTAYFDLIIPSSFYGKTVKVCWQWSPDWCGYVGSPAGYALDDYELWAP